MNLNQYFNYIYLYIIYFQIISCINIKSTDKLIISITSDRKNIHITKFIIKSIIDQNVDKYFYEILLILSSFDYENISLLPYDIQLLHQNKNIIIIFVKDNITPFKRTLITINKYPNNPFLIINNLCILPYGWLTMFLTDHIKYPNDAIAASIEYFFGKNYEIKEFSEGFKGKKFGTFNHVVEMIFNFAIINIDLGGILYPKKFFKNKSFYDYDLFIKSTNNSEDFWETSFIIMENKILRQSSRIFDYTNYVIDDINYNNYYINKKKLLEKSKFSFINYFYHFKDFIKTRQNKIIVSIASYPERFVYLPDLMTFIRKQNYKINKINFSFYKKHKKYFNLNINNVSIFYAKQNLKPHLKYYYIMQFYRDYAIITLDDDLGYSIDTFESLFNAYIENPNIISGRRAHLMTYKNSGELKNYFGWNFEIKSINISDFNLCLTNGAGTIFPPDILNINEKYLPIIKETLTCDDLTLKYFSIIKGIPHKWIFNNHIMGIQRILPKSNSTALFQFNQFYNDICINKLNMMINRTVLNNLCVYYKNIQTGIIIYLFDIHNQIILNNKLYFDVFAYSYCPIDNKMNFTIYFDYFPAFCYFNKSKTILSDNKNLIVIKKIATCQINEPQINLDEYYFPKAISNLNLFIKIYYYKKYLTTIFKSFYCQKSNICILKLLHYENIYKKHLKIVINEKLYLCIIDNSFSFHDRFLSNISSYKCKNSNNYLNMSNNNDINIISGLPKYLNLSHTIFDNNLLPKKFIILRIVIDTLNEYNNINIIGKLLDHLDYRTYNFTINLLYPSLIINCTMKPNSQNVQTYIYCYNKIKINKSNILIENQIVILDNNGYELVLINEETLIRIKFNENYNMINLLNEIKAEFKYKDNNYSIFYIFIIILIILIKIYYAYINKKKSYN